MAEWFGAPIMEKLINTGFQYLGDQVRWQTGMKEELKRLRENHPKIQAIVHFASSQEQIRDQNTALNEWLWQLRDAVDEADDVLDELEYMKLKNQLTKNKKQRKVRSIMKAINKRLVQIAKRTLKIDPNLKSLEKVVQKLDKVSAGVATFLHLVKDAKQEHQERQLELYRARETGSLPKNVLIGRGKDKDFVMKWLRNPSDEYQTTLYSNISLLSIVGQGGMGKTTLLQHVYKDEMTKEFDLKMWVCVSNNFDVNRVIANMLESLKNERICLDTLDALQKSLESVVKTKKFLLVLDDIWEENEERDKSKWENVLAPLIQGKLGSKILVTTRMDSAALMVAKVINKKNEMLRLEGLKDDECLLLLLRYAFVNVERLNDYHNLRSIAEKMVKKLSGSPLAARVIGGVLNSHLDESHWIRVLNYDIGSQNDISSVLKLSYIFLPRVLQNCLSFSAIFPQDYEYDKDDLIRMWIALGFIQLPNIPGETLKDVGERYFDFLVKKSLFDKFQSKHGIYYKLHDLLHMLVRSVSTQECFSVIGDEELLLGIPKTIRHLFVYTKNFEVLRKMKSFRNLRSLFLLYNHYEDFADGVLIEIFETLRSIRLLYICAPCLKHIPEVEHLTHLRYLNIVDTRVTRLPRSLSNLYHLQFLICDENFSNLREDDFLPRDLNNLLNLYYMKLPFPGMYDIGKLNSLQELDGFYVQNKAGYKLEELEHMNELCVLTINFLENVKDSRDACNAKLCDKRNLTDLSLVWRNIRRRDHYRSSDLMSHGVSNLDENVLDKLEPHSSLKKLKINSFMGTRSAIWMNNDNLISNLEYIQLEDCLAWQILPHFGHLPFLKYLYLRNMPKVKRFDYKFHGHDKDCLFPSLQVLDIKNLNALEDWFDTRTTVNGCLFPCLTAMCLHECPSLQELPSLPPKLKELEMVNIGWNAFNLLQDASNYCSILIQNLPNLISLRGMHEPETINNYQLILSELIIKDPFVLLMVPLTRITSIQKLEIQNNYTLFSFPIEVEQWFLKVSSSLCELNLKRLKFLQSFPSFLDSLSSLKILRVENVPQLQLLPNIPFSLERLELVELECLQSLPSSLESHCSLKILCVENVPRLQQLPNIPASLERLELAELRSLQCLPSSLSFSSLKHLELRHIPLQNLPDLPATLCELWLQGLECVNSLPASFHNLSSLQKLTINWAPQLQELPELPPFLCFMYLSSLTNLDCLPSCLSSLSSLQELTISDSPQLRELPDLPSSLKSLLIFNCHPELIERYQEFVGSDWHKIAHIPNVYIYTQLED
ncbi:Disease resistance protein RGA2 [Dendrobium catenatum]|uniref:Disease resistance protein RGA2 n=2 Tax=Dendrobium catenatum TaxID=906689 RepID=A0A2I0WXK7_9ASPA|nr:Disease resistance protein RGA2 [Dendrobium catenatum]